MNVWTTICWTGILLSLGTGARAIPELWDLSALQHPPRMRWIDKESPIRSLLYEGEPFNGNATEIFAFYATPGTISGDISTDKDLPAVVLLHGGGGTAFAEWVWLWAKRGYAAIAMDQSGKHPRKPAFDPETGELIVMRARPARERKRLENGGPEANHVHKFGTVGGEIYDQWQVHAVAAAIRAHSLIRSFPEVDPGRAAVTGISWGGYLTCLAASIDHRFKAAVPVYGCGYLHEGESVQKKAIDRLSPELRALWIKRYDPSNWVPQCRTPILFVNGTNDKHYPLDSYMKSYDAVTSDKQLRVEIGMPHGHAPGWEPEEIGAFIDHHLLGAPPLPKLGKPVIENGLARVFVQTRDSVREAKLHFTGDHGPLVERTWQSLPAKIDGNALEAEVPANATVWMFSVTDNRGLMVSSEVQFSE